MAGLAQGQLFFFKNSVVLRTAAPICSNLRLTRCRSLGLSRKINTIGRPNGLWSLFQRNPAPSNQKVPVAQITPGKSQKIIGGSFINQGRRFFSSSPGSLISKTLTQWKQAENVVADESIQKSSEGGSKNSGEIILSSKSVAYWLLGSAALVFGIVILGGLTRLTESGLSITEWKPVTGAIPPWTEEEWAEEFEKYQNSPEFKLLNSHITLDDFKFIFYMEWGHRLWGRAIGVLFVLPMCYFMLRRKVSPRVAKRLVGITGLIGFQGFIGWWMVKSGLSEEFLAEPNAHPRVSQYRLTAHLSAAFVVYLSMLWTGLEILREHKWASNPTQALETFRLLSDKNLVLFKRFSIALLPIVFITAMSGAMVAGLDAGLIYNSFPYMGETIIPATKELFSTVYCRAADQSDLIWRNICENPTTVQFIHRCLATSTFFIIMGHHAVMIAAKKAGVLPAAARKAGIAVVSLVSLQVALGISTLIYIVPTPLAAAHQAGALALLTAVLTLASTVVRPRAAIRQLVSRLASQSKKRTVS